VELEGFPRHGEQLVTHAREATAGDHRAGHTILSGVDHQFVDLARILTLPT